MKYLWWDAIKISGSHHLVRVVFLRGLAFVYISAFLVAFNQNKALIGDNGITPARDILNKAESKSIMTKRTLELERKKRRYNIKECRMHHQSLSLLKRYILKKIENSLIVDKLRTYLWDRSDNMSRPILSLLWILDSDTRAKNINPYLDAIALIGLVSAIFIFITGSANVFIIFTLWICQRSLMSVGGTWYSYGWEPQLAEITFHALFLVPFSSLSQINDSYISPIVIWSIRWYLFRIMIGSGLIKIRGDKKWRDLTAMDNFFETQPVPNPFSWYFHHMPKWWHKSEVLANHFVELIAPWIIIIPYLPTNIRSYSGIIQLWFQCVLILSGNLSFLNWLTMLPSIFCFEDKFFTLIFPSSTVQYALTITARSSCTRTVITFSYGLIVIILTKPIIKNLLSNHQLMNASFDPFQLINTYGAFGSVNDQRYEIIIQSAIKSNGPWKEYEFKVKPGLITRYPKWISPYHHRLDWQIWIAACSCRLEYNTWIFSFLLKLLEEDELVLGLLDPTCKTMHSRNENVEELRQTKPKYIRVMQYKYEMNRNYDRKTRKYWSRTKVRELFPKTGVCDENRLRSIVDYIEKRQFY